VTIVMRTGYRVPNRTQVVAVFTPSAILCSISIGAWTPLWGIDGDRTPCLTLVTPPLLTTFFPPALPFDWLSQSLPAGLVLWAAAFSCPGTPVAFFVSFTYVLLDSLLSIILGY